MCNHNAPTSESRCLRFSDLWNGVKCSVTGLHFLSTTQEQENSSTHLLTCGVPRSHSAIFNAPCLGLLLWVKWCIHIVDVSMGWTWDSTDANISHPEAICLLRGGNRKLLIQHLKALGKGLFHASPLASADIWAIFGVSWLIDRSPWSVLSCSCGILPMCVFLCPSSPFYTPANGWRAHFTSIWPHLGLTKYLSWPYFQIFWGTNGKAFNIWILRAGRHTI